MGQEDFSARLVARGTWAVCGEGCDCYLVEGDKEAIMVDAGQSLADIRAFAQGLTQKPLRRVVNTHSHFDHTGANGRFDEVLITREAALSAKTVMDANAASYNLDYGFSFVKDGDEICLGARTLRLIELGCHSPGSAVLLDEREGLLFCGDEVDTGQILLLPGYAQCPGQIHARAASTVEECLAAMHRLQTFEPCFSLLCPAHNGAPVPAVYIQWLAALCGDILSGREAGTQDCSSRSYHRTDSHFPYPGAGYRRARHEGASLVYCGHLLRAADKAGAEALPPATPLHIMCAGGVFWGGAAAMPNEMKE